MGISMPDPGKYTVAESAIAESRQALGLKESRVHDNWDSLESAVKKAMVTRAQHWEPTIRPECATLPWGQITSREKWAIERGVRALIGRYVSYAEMLGFHCSYGRVGI